MDTTRKRVQEVQVNKYSRIDRYQNNEARIRAFGKGVTYQLAGNVGTLTIPQGVDVLSFSVGHSQSDISNNNEFVLRIVDNNPEFNEGDFTTFDPKNISFVYMNTAFADPPTSGIPAQDSTNNPTTPVINYTNYDDITRTLEITFRNMTQFADWVVKVVI